ncbi:hypothetical protein D3C79_521860 [compost metagenome]
MPSGLSQPPRMKAMPQSSLCWPKRDAASSTLLFSPSLRPLRGTIWLTSRSSRPNASCSSASRVSFFLATSSLVSTPCST